MKATNMCSNFVGFRYDSSKSVRNFEVGDGVRRELYREVI